MVLAPTSAENSNAQIALDYVLQMIGEGEIRFAGISSLVMAMCVFANLLSTQSGLLFLLTDGALRLSRLLDSSLALLSHARSEVRQISATVVYNITLSHTPPSARSTGGWCASCVPVSSDACDVNELPGHAVQV